MLDRNVCTDKKWYMPLIHIFSTICSTNQPVLDDPDNYQSDLDELYVHVLIVSFSLN